MHTTDTLKLVADIVDDIVESLHAPLLEDHDSDCFDQRVAVEYDCSGEITIYLGFEPVVDTNLDSLTNSDPELLKEELLHIIASCAEKRARWMLYTANTLNKQLPKARQGEQLKLVEGSDGEEE